MNIDYLAPAIAAVERALATYNDARPNLNDAYERLRGLALQQGLRPVVQHRSLMRRAKALIAECREGVDDA